MPIFFKPSASDFSLSSDSIGNRWLQEPVVRPNGFPLYHWIQTERGEGLLTLEGQKLLLKPGDGVLIAPHVPHEYREGALALGATPMHTLFSVVLPAAKKTILAGVVLAPRAPMGS